ncbi:MAG: type 2 isopentenyl-diphosphate Delta-isomerase [Anaerolineae bacterium UTCFX2]|jgi:isopentenyl-diphosphate delta-isomerase|nr:type 2 isopentenyl-diphosphate Delta-isomerase [Anaerolineales bacterium]OQY93482.1 MAG: type 2 isopentenyl-diphosphate Delta-isomerase [Anaerolineae bacterium UTCFX2]
MPEVTPIGARKSDHIRINLEEDVRSGLTTGLERYRFQHRALPELDLEAVNLSQELFGRKLAAPILISSMTGGTEEAAAINRRLAQAAQQTGVAMGVGSQRAAIEHPELAGTFQVRREAPDVLLFANLGAVQLNYGYGVDECRRAIEMIEADALILHLNALQEAVQPEGDTRFAGLTQRIEQVCRDLTVPVIAKEVGWGFSEADVRLLADAGVAAIDVAGAGGTSWSQVELHRAKTDSQKRLAAAFVNWGIPTSEAILEVRRAAPQMTVIASGGLRSGVDVAKCIALGARLGGMASPFLKAAAVSVEDTIQTIQELRWEIQVCMFVAGAGDLNSLQQLTLIRD